MDEPKQYELKESKLNVLLDWYTVSVHDLATGAMRQDVPFCSEKYRALIKSVSRHRKMIEDYVLGLDDIERCICEGSGMKWLGLAIIIGAVILSALPVAAGDHEAENAARRDEWLERASRCQKVVDDMEAKGMKGEWVMLSCLRHQQSI